MVKVNELRIGNLINLTVNYQEVTHRIDEIGEDYAKLTDAKGSGMWPQMAYRTMTPIPLTPEWLERCGFVDNIPWEKGSIRLDSESRLHVVDKTGYGIIVARNVQYVHQLQNIYFYLTGEELNVKL